MKRLKYISKANSSVVQICIDCLTMFIEHGTTQQYFKFNIAKYFELVSKIVEAVNYDIKHFQFFFEKNVNKNLIATENFLKYFLEILIPTFGKCILNNNDFFYVISQIVQKVCTDFFYIKYCLNAGCSIFHVF